MNYDRPGYLLYQTVHRRPLTVAYISRDDPRTLTERVSLLQRLRRLGPDILADEPARVGLTTLGDLGVEYVALDRYKMPGGDERTVTEAIAAEVFAGQTPLYTDERLTVYRVPPAVPQPYVVLDAQNWGPLTQRGDTLARDINNGAACFSIQHPAAQMHVALRYGAAPGVEAELVAANGAAARNSAAGSARRTR